MSVREREARSTVCRERGKGNWRERGFIKLEPAGDGDERGKGNRRERESGVRERERVQF